eukprot:gene3979-7930_t
MFAASLVHEKELFENERFSPMSGWSSKGLLMTDRKAFSTRDGSISWSTLEQAEDGLMSYGWEWDKDSNWVVDTNFPGTDGEGWSYDVNFGTFESASATKGMMHFVRRRRRTRNLHFVASRFFTGTCDHIDLAERDRIAEKLLQVVSAVSSRQGAHATEVGVNKLKNKLLEVLNLNPNSERMPIFNFHARIDSFAETTNSMWRQASTSMSNAFTHNDRTETLSNHTAEISSLYFQSDERLELATILIRKHDTNNEFHCNKNNCGTSCLFSPTKCLNEGCSEVVSLKWATAHDDKCPHKIVSCKRECGDTFPRRLMDTHLINSCPLRPVFCPFNEMGCNVTELTHKALPDHMDCCTQSHLLLVLNRITEHQNVIVNLKQKTENLEMITAANTSNIAGLDAALAANVLAIDHAERRTLKVLRDEATTSDKKISTAITSLTGEVNTLKTTMTKLKHDLKIH